MGSRQCSRQCSKGRGVHTSRLLQQVETYARALVVVGGQAERGLRRRCVGCNRCDNCHAAVPTMPCGGSCNAEGAQEAAGGLIQCLHSASLSATVGTCSELPFYIHGTAAHVACTTTLRA